MRIAVVLLEVEERGLGRDREDRKEAGRGASAKGISVGVEAGDGIGGVLGSVGKAPAGRRKVAVVCGVGRSERGIEAAVRGVVEGGGWVKDWRRGSCGMV